MQINRKYKDKVVRYSLDGGRGSQRSVRGGGCDP